jgi:hypothetical protein
MHAQRTIRRPAAEVAEFFFDASNNPAWQTGMRSCEWETGGPITTGSTYVQVASFLGRTIRSRFEVTEYTPGSSIVVDTLESTFPITVVRTVSPIDAGSCRVEATITGGPGGLMRLLSPLTRRLAQRSVDRDYDRLVRLLG